MATKKLALDRATARKRLLSMPPEQRAAVLANCGESRHVVQHVLIEDMTPEQYGKRYRCHAPAMIDIALSRLAKIMA